MSPLHRCVLSIGSNVGDRAAHLQAALDALPGLGIRPVAVSPVYETAPVGGPDQGPYLNAVAIVETDAEPRAVLEACHVVEAQRDRRRELRWGPRTLDVDVIAYDDLRQDDPHLTLPHPRAAARRFVCVPWLDIDPAASLPEGPVRQLAEGQHDQVVVRRDDVALDLRGDGVRR